MHTLRFRFLSAKFPIQEELFFATIWLLLLKFLYPNFLVKNCFALLNIFNIPEFFHPCPLIFNNFLTLSLMSDFTKINILFIIFKVLLNLIILPQFESFARLLYFQMPRSNLFYVASYHIDRIVQGDPTLALAFFLRFWFSNF